MVLPPISWPMGTVYCWAYNYILLVSNGFWTVFDPSNLWDGDQASMDSSTAKYMRLQKPRNSVKTINNGRMRLKLASHHPKDISIALTLLMQGILDRSWKMALKPLGIMGENLKMALYNSKEGLFKIILFLSLSGICRHERRELAFDVLRRLRCIWKVVNLDNPNSD